MADINLLTYTTFTKTSTYTGQTKLNNVVDGSFDSGHEGLYSIDGDFNTYAGASHALVNSGESGHSTDASCISQHIFDLARDISTIKYRLYSYNMASGLSCYVTWLLKVQYTTNGTDWIDIAASVVSGSDSYSATGRTHIEDAGTIELTVNLSDVLGIRASVVTHGQVAESWTETKAWIYELEAYGQPYNDIGLRFYDNGSIQKIGVEPTLTSKLRIYKGSTIYGIPLVDTTDTLASTIRIYDGSEVKSLPLVT